jgi:hypothetical protein
MRSLGPFRGTSQTMVFCGVRFYRQAHLQPVVSWRIGASVLTDQS